MSKVKASENKAGAIETKPQRDIKDMSSEDLLELQGQQYETILNCQNTAMQCQTNIRVIKQIIEKRKALKGKDNGSNKNE